MSSFRVRTATVSDLPDVMTALGNTFDLGGTQVAWGTVLMVALYGLAWFVLSERVSATVSSLTTLMVPVVGVLGAMALVGDRPSALDWLGFALVLGGAPLVMLKLPPRNP